MTLILSKTPGAWVTGLQAHQKVLVSHITQITVGLICSTQNMGAVQVWGQSRRNYNKKLSCQRIGKKFLSSCWRSKKERWLNSKKSSGKLTKTLNKCYLLSSIIQGEGIIWGRKSTKLIKKISKTRRIVEFSCSKYSSRSGTLLKTRGYYYKKGIYQN